MAELKKGEKYNFKGQAERLVYLGKNISGNWYCHQFALDGYPDKVWAEILDCDLRFIERSKSPATTQT